jgi:hypothetical protein
MRTPTILRLSALSLIVLAGGRARADQISWSYGFSQSTTTIASNASSDVTGSVVLTPFTGTLTSSLPSSATITAVNLEALSSASAKNPAQFTNAEYTLIMRFTDLSSGLTAAVTFEGVLNGTVSASGASLNNSFIGQTAFSFDLNHHVYDISIGDFRAPGAPGSGDLGSISVDVELHHNPEPSSLLLGALGMPAFGIFLRRWRR